MRGNNKEKQQAQTTHTKTQQMKKTKHTHKQMGGVGGAKKGEHNNNTRKYEK